jgi:hypothetical protein
VSAFLAVLEIARLALVRLHQTTTGALLLYRTPTAVDWRELESL